MANSKSRSTLLQVARAAGVSLTAASMGLRNHPRIGAATRRKIQAVAKRLGYKPDPHLSRLMWILRNNKAVSYQETLGFLSDNAQLEEWRSYSQADYYLGASDRASELGYRMEIFHLRAAGMTPANLSRVLRNRGIRGLVVSAFRDPNASLDIDWPHFATVACGYSLTRPLVDRTTTDYYRAMLMATEKLAAEGFKRIGLCLNLSDDTKVLHLWQSAFLLFQHRLPEKARLPIHDTSVAGQGNIRAWVQDNRPDAVISAGCDFPQEYERATGRAASTKICYVNLNIHHADARSRGIDQDSYLVGRHACSHLVALLQRNELGLPQNPQITLTEFRWVEDRRDWQRAWQRRNARLQAKAE
ncbi:MAG TPA: LacI family DNA-binding transcriptional regulator [Opitutaceae bacterium]|nr:LacI family DNA-binding transcriptional regulator [Opitutaceae bacterium]